MMSTGKNRLSTRRQARLTTALVGTLAAFVAAPAWAQAPQQDSSAAQQPPPAPGAIAPASAARPADQSAAVDEGAANSAPVLSEVTVTGTRIRGLATPTGSNLVTVTQEQIRAIGAPDATQLLNQTVSQLPTFNTLAGGAAGNANTVPRLGLRGFGNAAGNASGGTATLILFNGHRVVFTGYGSSDVDPNSIPADILENVQVMPDGGSASYGSDAVGGVINFVTRKRVDGIQAHVQTGQADNYHTNFATVTAGKTWTSGSVLFSVNFSNNNALLNKDRPYTSVDYTRFGGLDYRTTFCPYGSFAVNGAVYTAPSFTPVAERPKCEQNANSSLTPKQRRTNVFGYFEQDLTPDIKFSVDAFYSRRDVKFFTDVNSLGTTATINASNPYFRPVAGEASQTVTFSYANALGPYRVSPQELTNWQVSPKLTWNIDSNWVAEANFIYGHSTAEIHDRSSLSTALINATNVNPYDTSAMPSALVGSVGNYEILSIGKNELASAQASVNGSLFTLPGGDAKVAVGGEYTRLGLTATNGLGPIGASQLRTLNNERNILAAFGEVFVPIFGEGNSRPGLRALDLDIALRYDHYDDFGDTLNPRIGVNYRPVEQLLIRGNYQTTFTAASLADSGLNDNILQVIPVAAGVYRLNVAGTGSDLKPMTGKTFSVGFDWTPDIVPGLRIGGTYWNTRLKNLVSQALAAYGGSAFASRTPYALCGSGYNQFAASVNGACTQAQLLNIQNTLGTGRLQTAAGVNTVADLFQPGVTIATVIDARRGNFGLERISGLDFELAYKRDVSFGSVFASVNGSYILNKEIAATPTAPFVDYISGKVVNPQVSRFSVSTTVGASHGPVALRVNVTHTGGYDIPPGTVGQSRIGTFTLTNLTGSYKVGDKGGLRDIVLEGGVDNLFDVSPPFNSAQGTSGYPQAGTLGRLVRFGIRTGF
jgi:iron complex outermembrane receptor protein